MSDLMAQAAALNAMLLKVPALFEANVKRGALGAAGKVIAAQAKINAPTGLPSTSGAVKYGGRVGLLRDSVRVKTWITPEGEVFGSVKAGGKVNGASAYYAWWSEYGSAAHAIKAKNSKSLHFGNSFATSVSHPGTAPKPWMRPALDATRDAAIQAFNEYANKRLADDGWLTPDTYQDEK